MCKISPVSKQFLTIFCCNLLTFSFGMATGWATINFNELQSENCTFPTGPLSLEEASLVVSLLNIGGFFGNWITLLMNNIFGIKRTIHLFGVPLILSALLIIWAQNVYYVYVSRVLSGLVGGGVSVGIATLIQDISHDSMRGALNSLYDPMNNLGIIISFFLGNNLNWLDQVTAQLIAPIIFMIIMFLIPESPEYLTNRNKDKRAIKAHKFYKGSAAALEHAEFLQKLKDEKVEKGMSDNDENQTEMELNTKISLRDFCTPHAKRAYFISFVGLILSFLTGSMLILGYVTDIFTKTGSSLSPKNSSLLVSVVQIIANCIFLYIVERVNRRTLQISSSILTTISFFLFAIYCSFWINQPNYDWMPTTLFTCIVLFSWLGLIPIPFIITIEIFPKKIRHTCLALAISLFWIVFFILGMIFPIFLETYETRGKSYDEIMKLMVL
ncbi:facilitated trehalose transporter Tret1-like isoform X2 [Sitodiplosis mosellana]|uniref:facilitated trehalose transporter Tret1-like isoform X2 n=1 Tax=Sitodiplosis mosellana TaxID=263140 RepID=UPI0024452FAA|nr:facilitated trehalose transporter Tret1-like isoform X2 [Sitodiplosis mosellana]